MIVVLSRLCRTRYAAPFCPVSNRLLAQAIMPPDSADPSLKLSVSQGVKNCYTSENLPNYKWKIGDYPRSLLQPDATAVESPGKLAFEKDPKTARKCECLQKSGNKARIR
jgi:hypothetical protein